jgi:hypothetical protein
MEKQDQDVVRLKGIEGISRLSGEEAGTGCQWTQFTVDYGAEQEDGECSICGATLRSGWLCLDGGEEVCSKHVHYVSELALKPFLRQYVETALWSSTDPESSIPLDRDYSHGDLSREALTQMEVDCEDFLLMLPEHLVELVDSDLERAGHDFWLTRNHHGAGFWDGDWGEAEGRELTKLSHAYGSADLYIGDDGQIYHS